MKLICLDFYTVLDFFIAYVSLLGVICFTNNFFNTENIFSLNYNMRFLFPNIIKKNMFG